jgi:hypothetical protein
MKVRANCETTLAAETLAEKPGAAGTGKQGNRRIAVSGSQHGDAGTFRQISHKAIGGTMKPCA